MEKPLYYGTTKYEPGGLAIRCYPPKAIAADLGIGARSASESDG